MALRAGLPGATIAKILRGDETEMTEPTRLGARFARAVLARAPAADEIREEIARRWQATLNFRRANAAYNCRFPGERFFTAPEHSRNGNTIQAGLFEPALKNAQPTVT